MMIKTAVSESSLLEFITTSLIYSRSKPSAQLAIDLLKGMTSKAHFQVHIYKFKEYTKTFTNVLIIWRRKWQPLQDSCLAQRESCGYRSLVGCCQQGNTESDMTEVAWHACTHALEKEMETHSRILTWRIPGTEKPDGLSSKGSHGVRHN